MTTDEQITQFNRVVQDRIDEIQVLEARIQDRAKALMEAHQAVLAVSPYHYHSILSWASEDVCA